MSQSHEGLIIQIDTCLGRYYQKLGSNNYFINETGKFQTWCDDNEYADDDVADEIADADPNNSCMTDFDDEFPFVQTPYNRNGAIFDIIKKCSLNENLFTDNMMLYAVFEPTKDDWCITKQELHRITNIYKSQLPKLCDKAMGEDQSLMKLLAIGYKQNVPYLSFLADCYLRDSLRYFLEAKESLHVGEWARINTHFNKLKKLNTGINMQAYTEAEAAVTSYFKRICPVLSMSNLLAIDDSIEDICEYILSMVDFVYTLSKRELQHCPFQVDNCFIFNHVSNKTVLGVKGIDMGNTAKKTDESDDDDDDDDDDVDCEFCDHVCDIKEKLKHNNLPYLSNMDPDIGAIGGMGNPSLSTLSADTSHVSGVAFASRILHQFKEFKRSKLRSKYKGGEFSQYPRNKRVVIVVDRRDRDPKNANDAKYITDEDEIIIFEPPANCNSIPHAKNIKHVPEWFMASSKTCIIPNIGYNKKMEEERKGYDDYKKENEAENAAPPHWYCPRCETKNDLADTDCVKCKFNEKQNELVTSASACGSGLVILSFHVESCDEIKCYLYWQGAFIRFLPQDIATVLPLIFNNQCNGNEGFGARKVAQDLIKILKPKMRDYPFESFYNEYKLSKQKIAFEKKTRHKLESTRKLMPDLETSTSVDMRRVYDDDIKQELTISKSEPAPNEVNEGGALSGLIFWLKSADSSTNYASHWELVEAELWKQFDDELDIDELIEDLGEEDDCEYISVLTHDATCNANYLQYISQLVADLMDYKAIQNVL